MIWALSVCQRPSFRPLSPRGLVRRYNRHLPDSGSEQQGRRLRHGAVRAIRVTNSVLGRRAACATTGARARNTRRIERWAQTFSPHTTARTLKMCVRVCVCVCVSARVCVCRVCVCVCVCVDVCVCVC